MRYGMGISRAKFSTQKAASSGSGAESAVEPRLRWVLAPCLLRSFIQGCFEHETSMAETRIMMLVNTRIVGNRKQHLLKTPLTEETKRNFPFILGGRR